MDMRPRGKETKQEDRSIFEIVSEDGPMDPKEILSIIDRLCRRLEDQKPENLDRYTLIPHPMQVILQGDGNLFLSESALPLSALVAYIPPEQVGSGHWTGATMVYALGVLMLFMATGQEKKGDLVDIVDNRHLRTIIEACMAFDPQLRFGDIKALSKAIKGASVTGKKSSLLLKVSAYISLAVVLFLFACQGGMARGGKIGKNLGYSEGYASGYEKGFSDAPGIGMAGTAYDPDRGNLSGNLTLEGGAMAVRSEDRIFFLLEGSLYQMDPYTKETQVLVTDVGAYGLNYYEDWLYYSTESKVFRVKPSIMEPEVFCDTHTGLLYITDGNFYLYEFSDTGYLYQIDPKTKALTQVNGSMRYGSLNIVDDRLYYIDLDKGSALYSSSLNGDHLTLISSNPYGSFSIYEDKIYACGTNAGRDGPGQVGTYLLTMDLNGGNPEILTHVPVQNPIVSEGGIFYLRGKDQNLEWMSINGRTQYRITSSKAGPFNLVGNWIFFRNEEEPGLWRIRIDGSDMAKLSP